MMNSLLAEITEAGVADPMGPKEACSGLAETFKGRMPRLQDSCRDVIAPRLGVKIVFRSESESLQDLFLEALLQEEVPVAIFLRTGIKLQGTIDSYDHSVILLKSTVTQMIYKHAVSTIMPARNVPL